MKRVLIPIVIVFVAAVIIIVVLLRRAVGEIDVDSNQSNYGNIAGYYDDNQKVDDEEKNKTLYEKHFGDKNNKDNDNQKTYTKDFGSYVVLNDFVESTKYSTNDKYFYILKSDENSNAPNNISINVEKNNYSQTDYIEFKNSLEYKLNNNSNGNGEKIKVLEDSTDNGDKIYTFTMVNNDIKTTCYYIVGNYKYILIQETVHGTSEQTDEVAKNMAISFKWK